MILVLAENVTEVDVKQLVERLSFMGLTAVVREEAGRFSLGIVKGVTDLLREDLFINLPHVVEVLPFHQRFKLAGRDFHPDKTVINVNDITIGGDELAVIAGSCSVESEQQIFETAEAVSQMGAKFLRGGAFKPRTSPYDFQGLGEVGLQYLSAAAKAHGMLSVTEVMDTAEVNLVAQYADVLQIGTRNMQNFSLLRAVGKLRKPVLLKRGFSSTYVDWLMAAEYILSEGNMDVILCERGIRTFESYTRNTLDLSAVPAMRALTHLPVVVDPSHGTGIREMVPVMAKAAVAAGADGVMVEVHKMPDQALSDAKQTIGFEALAELIQKMKAIRAIV